MNKDKKKNHKRTRLKSSKTHYSNSTARPEQAIVVSSYDAFDDFRDTSKYDNCEMQSLAALKGMGGEGTRKMISKATGLENSSMTQFVKGLLEKNLIHEETTRRPCKISGRKVFWLKVGPKPSENIDKSINDPVPITGNGQSGLFAAPKQSTYSR